jgi:hypothetical protein
MKRPGDGRALILAAPLAWVDNYCACVGVLDGSSPSPTGQSRM